MVKSRARRVHVNNLGGWMICDKEHNAIVHGTRWQLDLDDVAEWLDKHEAAIREADARAGGRGLK